MNHNQRSRTRRVSTGVAGLDRMLAGGLLPKRPYLVSGCPGSGKTTLCIQFLLDGVARNEQVLLVSLDEPPSEINENMKVFGWDLERIRILDATPDVRGYSKGRDINEIKSARDVKSMKEMSDLRKSSVVNPYEISVQSLHLKLKKEMDERRYDRVVIDSLTAVRLFAIKSTEDKETERLEIQSLLRFLSEQEVTTLIATEIPDKTTLDPEFFLTRGEIRLYKYTVASQLHRGIGIQRFRGSVHSNNICKFEICQNGIKVHWDETETISEDTPIDDEPEDERSPQQRGFHSNCRSTDEPVPAEAPNEESKEEENIDQQALIEEINELMDQIENDLEFCHKVGINVGSAEELVKKSDSLIRSKNYMAARDYARQSWLMIDARINALKEKHPPESLAGLSAGIETTSSASSPEPPPPEPEEEVIDHTSEMYGEIAEFENEIVEKVNLNPSSPWSKQALELLQRSKEAWSAGNYLESRTLAHKGWLTLADEDGAPDDKPPNQETSVPNPSSDEVQIETPKPPADEPKPKSNKPSGGRCAKCKGTNLQFNDDGSGQCPDCGREFRWDKKKN